MSDIYTPIDKTSFFIAHLIVLSGFSAMLYTLLILIRVVGYIVIIIAVYKLATKKKGLFEK